MAHKRKIVPEYYPSGNILTGKLINLGFKISGEELACKNIEHTILGAFIEFHNTRDFRLLGLLYNWFKKHHKILNTNRFFKLVKKLEVLEINYILSGFIHNINDHRLKKIQAIKYKERYKFLESSDFLLEKYGEDSNFSNTCLKIHSKLLSDRPNLIDDPYVVSKKNVFYKMRVALGATYRADIFATLMKSPNLSPTHLAKLNYSNYYTAHSARKDFFTFIGQRES